MPQNVFHAWKSVIRSGLILTLLSLIASSLVQTVDAAPTRKPVKLIFDTDMGNDIDDALALALIHALQDRGECELLAVTITKDNPHAAAFCDLVNTFYGRGNIPIGKVVDGKTPNEGGFVGKVANAADRGKQRYHHNLLAAGAIPNAATVLREVLAKQEDGSTVIVQVGFSTNLARLLSSKPDSISPLDGKSLIAKKVRLLSVMGGYFGSQPRKGFGEYNIKIDLPASKKLVQDWPGDIVFSGYEIGLAIQYPAVSIANDYNSVKYHPVREAYKYYQNFPYDRATWDLTSVLYAVRPEREYFALSDRGRVSIAGNASTAFFKAAQGKHRFLIASPQQVIRVRETFVHLCSQPPKK